MPVVAALLSRLAEVVALGGPGLRKVNLWPGPQAQVWVATPDDLQVWAQELGLDRPHRTRMMPTGRLMTQARGRVAGAELLVYTFTRPHHHGVPGDE